MNNIKFTPKKGILSNIVVAAKASSKSLAYSAVNAANGLRFLNHAISDGLATLNVMEEMAMAKTSNLLSEALGKEITIESIRNGEVMELVEEANASEREYLAKKGEYKLAKKNLKLLKKLEKLDKKIQKLDRKVQELEKEEVTAKQQ